LNQPLRITIALGPFIPTPPASTGAIEHRWVEVAERCAARGHQVTLISRQHPDLPDRETRAGVEHIRCRGYDRSGKRARDLWRDWLYARRVKHAAPASDILLTNVFWLPAILGKRRADFQRVNVHIARFPKRQLLLYRRAERISTVSSAIAQAIVKQTPPLAPRVKVIPNPVNTEIFQPPAEHCHRSRRDPTVLYTGRVHAEKGLELLVDAVGQLSADYPTLKLRIVGPYAVGQGGGGEALVRRLQHRAGRASVEFAGPVFDKRQLARELHDATHYCYPSLAFYGEACPVAPLEAMATGLAPIVSDLPQFQDYLTDQWHGLVFERNPSDAAQRLAACLRRQIENPEEAKQMGQRAHEKALTLSNDAVAERYLEDFYTLLNASPERRR
jgi:glycosyltransferase involved in cell wall biosynthesis